MWFYSRGFQKFALNKSVWYDLEWVSVWMVSDFVCIHVHFTQFFFEFIMNNEEEKVFLKKQEQAALKNP